MELKNKKINFLGDSITQGCGTTDKSRCFCSLIEANTGAICRNYGLVGTRIARQTIPSECKSFDLDFCKRAEEMDTDADIVVVFGGTNDYGHGDAPLGTMVDRTVYTFYGALHTLCQYLITNYINSTIVFITPLHRINEGNLKGDSKKIDVAPLKEYVNIIREVVEYYSLPLLDLYANSGLQPELKVIRDNYVYDGLHPNDAGHQILARKIASFLETL